MVATKDSENPTIYYMIELLTTSSEYVWHDTSLQDINNANTVMEVLTQQSPLMSFIK